MQQLKWISLALLASIGLTFIGCKQPASQPDSNPSQPEDGNGEDGDNRPIGQLRGLWIDGFGPGIKTPDQISQLVSTAKNLNINVLFAQIGRRGDCYCNKAIMPRTEDPAVAPQFDPLADLITKAHAEGLQVHAWIITTAIWREDTPPKAANHVFNTHGPSAQGRDNWLTVKADGTLRGGKDWYLDPGHPDAAEYIKKMYVSLAKNYNLDGLQFDRVRYPDGNPVNGPIQWGYNATALKRFMTETNTQDRPQPGNVVWSKWRRQQLTNLVRETALAVKALKPALSISAATITYGPGPTDDEPFQVLRPYTEVGQDWYSWVKNGYLDINVMMNYKRDFKNDQSRWFDQWNTYAAQLLKNYPDVAQVSGTALYLNDQNSSLNQIKKTFRANLSGWTGYSYRTPTSKVNQNTQTKEQAWAAFKPQLTGPGMPFETSVKWQTPKAYTFRAVAGGVKSKSGLIGHRTIELIDNTGQVVAETKTDGYGRYGFMRVPTSPFVVRSGDVISAKYTALPGQVQPLPILELP